MIPDVTFRSLLNAHHVTTHATCDFFTQLLLYYFVCMATSVFALARVKHSLVISRS